jgi:hypothetical protein
MRVAISSGMVVAECRSASPDRVRGGTSSVSCFRRDAVDVQEVRKLDAYLKKLFGNARLRVVPRPRKDDSAEVYIGEEFVGVLFIDDEDDERSYTFQMAILATDLE